MMKSRGFTIVELLIVIVVIGILAAITVVAFNGVQTRANNTQSISTARSWIGAFEAYAAANGNYPANTIVAQDNYCLGIEPSACVTSPYWYRNTTLESDLRTIAGNLPAPKTSTLLASTTNPVLGYIPKRTGADTPRVNGLNSALIIYMLQGNAQKCGLSGVVSGGWPDYSSAVPSAGYTADGGGVTLCVVALPGR